MRGGLALSLIVALLTMAGLAIAPVWVDYVAIGFCTALFLVGLWFSFRDASSTVNEIRSRGGFRG